MNKVILMGRLTKDADVRYGQGDEPVACARFTLAVDRKYRKDVDKKADFISCVAFGKLGEFVEKYGTKGTKFVLEGRIQTGSYTNKEGQTIYTTDVFAESMEFAESKSSNQGGFNAIKTEIETSEFLDIPDGIDDEIPFV